MGGTPSDLHNLAIAERPLSIKSARTPYRKEPAYSGLNREEAMANELATLTAKGQVTIPKAVRDSLGLQKGDQLSWELEDGSVRVRAVKPLDVAFLQGVEQGLQEWQSTEDEQAFADL